MGEAFAIAKQEMAEESARIKVLREKLWQGIQKLTGVYLNGDDNLRIPGILNIAFDGIETSLLLPALKDFAVSTGSACHANSLEPSRVLKAIGLTDHLAFSSIRFSIGRFTTEEEIDFAIKKITEIVIKLRSLNYN